MSLIDSVYVMWAAFYFCWWGGIMRLGWLGGSGEAPFPKHGFMRMFMSIHLLALGLVNVLSLPGVLSQDSKSAIEPFLHIIGLTDTER